MPVFRYAEVLLDYAEAKAELGELTQGDLDISVNLIRARVGMPSLDMAAANANPDPYLMSSETGYPNVSGANKGVILEIRRERAIELFQEGYGRYFDLMRWKAGYCLNQPFYGMYIPGPGEYSFGDDSKYTFYVGSPTRSSTSWIPTQASLQLQVSAMPFTASPIPSTRASTTSILFPRTRFC